jgi:hypothetical protein
VVTMAARCTLCPEEDARPVEAPCVACGRAVCASHRWTMLGLCHECATRDEVLARAQAAMRHPRELLDIKWVE